MFASILSKLPSAVCLSAPLVFPFHGEVLTMLPSFFSGFCRIHFLARAADVLFQYPVRCTQPLSRVACNFRLASVSVMRGAQKGGGGGGGETKDFFYLPARCQLRGQRRRTKTLPANGEANQLFVSKLKWRV